MMARYKNHVIIKIKISPERTRQNPIQESHINMLRKPWLGTLTFISILCIIYFMSSSASPTRKSLGESVPMKPVVETSSLSLTELDKHESVSKGSKSDSELSELTENSSSKEENGDTSSSAQVGKEFTETPFMPKMANETLKAQLGNSAWRLFHTILARYPEKPSKVEQSTLDQYIQLFAQVYPCGDCARHFRQLLDKYPPQTGSRKTAALWGCSIHNKVNERLGKERYDCSTILEDYDCGCGDDEKLEDETIENSTNEELRKVELNKEPNQLGG